MINKLYTFIILAKKIPSSRSVKGHSPVSRWWINWLRTRDGMVGNLLLQNKPDSQEPEPASL
ncbi:hypothetical protein DJ87_4904 [Bacillus cereus]|nr:hypothetical protein DJ87_4904 [Bacillus cereus]